MVYLHFQNDILKKKLKFEYKGDYVIIYFYILNYNYQVLVILLYTDILFLSVNKISYY